MISSVVRAERASKRYGAGPGSTLALQEISLAIAVGEFVAVTGRSGCGKSTLLNLLGAMDTPTSGRIWLDGAETSRLNDDALTALRRRAVGFVFQAFHLVPTLTVRENIELPLLLAGRTPGARVRQLAERVDIAAKLEAFPHQLSGGEMQRAALARAVVHQPRLVIADEPTGNLDSQSSELVLTLLEELNRDSGAAVIMATHNPEAASRAHRIVHMKDGALTESTAIPA